MKFIIIIIIIVVVVVVRGNFYARNTISTNSVL